MTKLSEKRQAGVATVAKETSRAYSRPLASVGRDSFIQAVKEEAESELSLKEIKPAPIPPKL